ncbi:hypothetical protein FQA39_LY11426 [Lamprigera yunnana]|nr:hypothetical protein FQA39_LY11426 [Lamprigera yunnana]
MDAVKKATVKMALVSEWMVSKILIKLFESRTLGFVQQSIRVLLVVTCYYKKFIRVPVGWEERDLETSGVKLVVQERLQQWLVQNDQDPESFSFETPEGKIMRKMQKNSKTIKEGLMEKLEENSITLKEMLEEKVNTINKELEEKVNTVKDKLIENSRKTKEELNHRVDEVFQKCKELQKKYAFLTTWDYTIEEVIPSVEQDDTTKLLEERMNCIQLPSTATNMVGTINTQVKEERDPATKMKVKPSIFVGKVPWSTYHKQLEAAEMANRWTNEEKVDSLVVALRGDVLNILQTVSGNQQNDYRVKKSGEGLQEFQAIYSAVCLAYPTVPDSFLEQLAIQTFMDGIRDRKTQQSLRLARPKTVDDALAHAMKFEAAKQASRDHGRVRAVAEEPERSQDRLEELLLRVLRKEASDKKERPEARKYKCWNCGERGHLRRRCPKPRKKWDKNQNKDQDKKQDSDRDKDKEQNPNRDKNKDHDKERDNRYGGVKSTK